jgi:hypothetical protein
MLQQLRRSQSEIEIDQFVDAYVNYCILDNFFSYHRNQSFSGVIINFKFEALK